MGLFKSRSEKELDWIIQKLEMNMSNNYKDNAQDNFRELEKSFNEKRESGVLKGAALTKYGSILDDYRERLKGFSHKDQKPYWH